LPRTCNGASSTLPVLHDAPAECEGVRHNRVLLQPSPCSPLQKERQQGHVENIFQGAQPLCGPQRVPRATIMHTLEYEALKTTPGIAVESAGGNGRERVGGAESSRVREGGGAVDRKDTASKSGRQDDDSAPAGVASCLSPYIGPPSRTDVKFHYRHGISAHSEEKVDQVRFEFPQSQTVLHPQQGDAQGSARQDDNGQLPQHVQSDQNVGRPQFCVDNTFCVGDTEGYGPQLCPHSDTPWASGPANFGYHFCPFWH